jgi:hypothetical protein
MRRNVTDDPRQSIASVKIRGFRFPDVGCSDPDQDQNRRE